MTKDSLYKLIQSFFSSGVTVIVGSGLSCAEGLPGMWELSQELLKNVPPLIDSTDATWINIASELGNNKGLEETLLRYQPTVEIETAIKQVTTNFIESREYKEIEEVITTERSLRISSLIKKLPIDNLGLNMITTNYDRLIEIGCNLMGIGIDTMFVGNTCSVLNESESRMSFCRDIKKTGRDFRLSYTKRVKLYKPHGCLSWRMVNNIPVSINFPINSDRLVITPGLNKFRAGYEKPFDIHREKANNAIDTASKFLIIGYGFNDDHLETHLMSQIEKGKQTLIITRGLSENATDLIAQYKNVYALSRGIGGGTVLTSHSINEEYDDIEVWDIGELCKEVF